MSESFPSESPLHLVFELVIFSVFSRLNKGAKKVFQSSAINFECELILISPFQYLFFALYILVKGFRDILCYLQTFAQNDEQSLMSCFTCALTSL